MITEFADEYSSLLTADYFNAEITIYNCNTLYPNCVQNTQEVNERVHTVLGTH